MKTAAQIRAEFLDFFSRRGHRIVPSAPVFPQDDPTLLFTNAGMNQFKDVFLGSGRRDYVRAADTQKCIRVSGKHNDLEEVGRDTYHHTFFEMLGNWSFGDYFKRDAIRWSWELLTDVWKLPKDRLWVTVFGGDPKDGLPADDESERIWIEECGLPRERVLRFGRKDNFWEMGDTGPCGPCTEIHFDRGRPDQNRADGADRAIGVNAGNERFMEIWNNVFMEFNRKADGSLERLPAQHVDTGMGFERVVGVIQGKTSNYDTDVFAPLFRAIEKLVGKTYGGRLDSETDVAFRVIADHVRALTAAVADGALPGNEGRGYVLRRLLRRAARFGTQVLCMQEPFIHKVVPAVAESLGEAFPEMVARRDHVMHVIEAEERAFAVTLGKGVTLFEQVAAEAEKRGDRTIPGDVAYRLYATFGFPRDLVDLMARDRRLAVDEKGWETAQEAHRSASRGEGGGKWLVDPDALRGIEPTRTLFYGEDGGDGVIAAVRPLKLIDGTKLVLDRTPFYAESGGQVGDTGVVEAPGFVFEVQDVQKMGRIFLHVGKLIEGDAARLPERATATVDAERRHDVMANHTATHLLHWALRETLGEQAAQQGSLVAPEKLRFDFTHARALTLDEIEKIERMVNDRIVESESLKTTEEDLAAAKARGVVALFGEKYDEKVRVVNIGGFSQELCGGTHCRSTGQIGAFHITSESAVQAGVRRIEAVTRGAAVRRLQEQRRALREATTLLKTSEAELPKRIAALQDQLKEAKKGGGARSAADVASLAKDLLDKATAHGASRAIVARVDVGAGELPALADALRNQRARTAGLLAAADEGKVALVAFATKDLAEAKTVNAGQVVKEVAPLVGGAGGGRPDLAQAGGKDAAGLDAALARARELFARALA
ncbi:MAG TPA: alanine--tRNA ligase [Planctomycetota bacterium]|nr:alanine--tRNA ligase [Planctomycetota bacterium]